MPAKIQESRPDDLLEFAGKDDSQVIKS